MVVIDIIYFSLMHVMFLHVGKTILIDVTTKSSGVHKISSVLCGDCMRGYRLARSLLVFRCWTFIDHGRVAQLGSIGGRRLGKCGLCPHWRFFKLNVNGALRGKSKATRVGGVLDAEHSIQFRCIPFLFSCDLFI